MLIVTTEAVPGYHVVEVLGQAFGLTARTHNPYNEGVSALPGAPKPQMVRTLAHWREEAIAELARSLIHVLDVRQGDGTYVTSLEPRLLLDAMTFVVDFHRDDTVLEFLEVRRILEPAATAMAALAMTEQQIAELRAVLDELDDEPSVESLVANDLEFHRRIALGSGNTVLCSLIESLSGPTTRARIWRGLTQEGAVARTREQHGPI